MDKTVNSILFFLAVSSIFLIDFGWGLKFTISPAVVSTIVPTDVSISCEVDNTELTHLNSRTESYARVRSMSIAQNTANYDKWIAEVHVNEQAVSLDSSVQAFGHVQEDGRNTYLHANITGLEFDQAQNISCYIHVAEKQILFSANQTIAANGLPAASSTTCHESLSLSYLSTEEIDYALGIGYIQARKTLEETKRFIHNQKRNLDWFVLKNSRNVYFRALMDKRDTYSNLTIVRFRKVTKESEGYSSRTGKFTAPYPGYYMFQIGWHVNIDSWQFIDIRTASRLLTRIGGMARDWRAYAEGGVVAKLDKGEKVYPYVSEAPSTSVVQTRDNSGEINHFSGYLMRPL